MQQGILGETGLFAVFSLVKEFSAFKNKRFYKKSLVKFLFLPGKPRKNRERKDREGDGTENVINCRDVCRKLS